MMRIAAPLSAMIAAGAAAAQTIAPVAPQSWAIPPLVPVVDRATLADAQQARGHDVFMAHCSHCHGQGRGMPGTASLGVKYGDALPALLEERTDLTPELVGFFVRGGVGAMAAYRKTELSDAELADLAAYLSRPRP